MPMKWLDSKQQNVAWNHTHTHMHTQIPGREEPRAHFAGVFFVLTVLFCFFGHIWCRDLWPCGCLVGFVFPPIQNDSTGFSYLSMTRNTEKKGKLLVEPREIKFWITSVEHPPRNKSLMKYPMYLTTVNWSVMDLG
jgi:hypothetical protein